MSVCLRQSISIASWIVSYYLIQCIWFVNCFYPRKEKRSSLSYPFVLLRLLRNANTLDSSIAFTLEKKKGHPYHILLFCSDYLEMQILLFLFSSLCFSTFYPSFQAPPPASYKSQFLIGGYALGFSKLG